MKLEINGDQAILHSSATPAVLALLPQLEGRRSWLKGSRALSLIATEHNISVLRSLPGLSIETTGLAEDEVPIRRPVMSYTSKTEPYGHQTKALEKMAGLHHFGLFMEQGTGKSKVVIDRSGQLFLEGKITGVLVVSKKGVHRQWTEGEFVDHCAVPWWGTYWGQKKTSKAPAGPHLEVFTINYDALRTKDGFKAASQFCGKHLRKLLIAADESQEIKNDKSIRSKAMRALAPAAAYRILATGTPIAKDLTDEWAQLKWLDESIIGIRYLTTFRAKYCVMGGFEGRVVVGHKEIDEFKSRTEPFVFRATKDDIGILPKQYNTWHFDLMPEQRKIIKQLRKQLEAEISDTHTISVANSAVALSKFQQVSAGFIIDEFETVHRLMPVAKNPRIQAAMEWLDSFEGKAIIWFRFREEAVMIAEALAEKGVSFAEYHGGVKDQDRQKAKDSFLSPSGVRVFLANPQSAGTGLNLQGLCQRALYFSNSFNAIDRWQSEDRIHRIGTKGAVTYTDLIAAGSLDAYIRRNLQKKKSLSQLVLDDIRDMLQELDDE